MMSPNKKTLQKICTGILCFFSLFSTAAAGLAWFASYKQVGGNGASVISHKDELFATYSIYKYNKSNIGTDEDDSTQEAIDEHRKLEVTGFTLNTYDTIFISQNQYTPALIKIHVYGSSIPDASVGNEKNLRVQISRNTSYVNKDESIDDPFKFKCISNVANFTLAAPNATTYQSYVSEDLDTIDNVETFFSETVASFRAGSDEGITFFDEEDSVVVKRNSISLSTKYNSTIKVDDINHVILYLYVDYNLDLLENFTKTNSLTAGVDFLGHIDTVLENDLSGINVILGA